MAIYDGSTTADLITGLAEADTIKGYDGDDTLLGLAGNDFLNGNKHNDSVEGGDGDDTVYGGSGNDILKGGLGNDTVSGDLDDDFVNGNAGNDSLEGGDGNDTVYGGQDHDIVKGLNGNDEVYGDLGNDFVNGNAGNDLVDGGDGNDEVHGGSGDDNVSGGNGNDTLYGELGNDTIDGGGGTADIAIFSGNSVDYTIDVNGTTTTITHNITGGDGTDIITNVEQLQFNDTSLIQQNGEWTDGTLPVDTKVLRVYKVGHIFDDIEQPFFVPGVPIPNGVENNKSVNAPQIRETIAHYVIDDFNPNNPGNANSDMPYQVIDLSAFKLTSIEKFERDGSTIIKLDNDLMKSLGLERELEIKNVMPHEINDTHFLLEPSTDTTTDSLDTFTDILASEWGADTFVGRSPGVRGQDNIGNDDGTPIYNAEVSETVFLRGQVGFLDDIQSFTPDANQPAGSVHTISNFDPTNPSHVINLSGFGITDPEKLGIKQEANNVVVNVGNGESVVIENTSIDEISAEDFVGLENTGPEVLDALDVFRISADRVLGVSETEAQTNQTYKIDTLDSSKKNVIILDNFAKQTLVASDVTELNGYAIADLGDGNQLMVRGVTSNELIGLVNNDLVADNYNTDELFVTVSPGLNQELIDYSYAGNETQIAADQVTVGKLPNGKTAETASNDDLLKSLQQGTGDGFTIAKEYGSSVLDAATGALMTSGQIVTDPITGDILGKVVYDGKLLMSQSYEQGIFTKTLIGQPVVIGQNFTTTTSEVYSKTKLGVVWELDSMIDVTEASRLETMKGRLELLEKAGTAFDFGFNFVENLNTTDSLLENVVVSTAETGGTFAAATLAVGTADKALATKTAQTVGSAAGGTALGAKLASVGTKLFGFNPAQLAVKVGAAFTGVDLYTEKLFFNNQYSFGDMVEIGATDLYRFNRDWMQEAVKVAHQRIFGEARENIEVANDPLPATNIGSIDYPGGGVSGNGNIDTPIPPGTLQQIIENAPQSLPPIQETPIPVPGSIAEFIYSLPDGGLGYYKGQLYQRDGDVIIETIPNDNDVDADSTFYYDPAADNPNGLAPLPVTPQSFNIGAVVNNTIDNISTFIQNGIYTRPDPNDTQANDSFLNDITTNSPFLDQFIADIILGDGVDEAINNLGETITREAIGIAVNTALAAAGFSGPQVPTAAIFLTYDVLQGDVKLEDIHQHVSVIAVNMAVSMVANHFLPPILANVATELIMNQITGPVIEASDKIADYYEGLYDLVRDPFNTIEDIFEDVFGLDEDKWTTGKRVGTEGPNLLVDQLDHSWAVLEGGDDVWFGWGGWSVVMGGAGNDTLIGADGDFNKSTTPVDQLFGGDGDDYIVGNGEHDDLTGNAGNDFIMGGDGDDVIAGGGMSTGWHESSEPDANGNDTIDGGEGSDSLHYQGVRDNFAIGISGEWTLITDNTGAEGSDQVKNVEVLHFSDMSLTWNGSTWVDGAGTPTVISDLLAFGNSDDNVDGTAGNDTISGGGGNDTLFGGDGDDKLSGGKNSVDNDQLFGGLGNDFLNGNAGNDLVDGEDGDDTVRGGVGNDTVKGRSGNDSVYGDRDDDFVNGNAGNDLVDGGEGNDTVHGGQGDDKVVGDDGNDIVYGEADNDFVNGNHGNDTVDGGDGNDTVHGGQQNDSLYGGDGDDILSGDKGDDTVDGGAGNDIAVFSGNQANYVVTVNGATTTLQDTVGEDGTDVLSNINTIRFADGDVDWTTLTSTPPGDGSSGGSGGSGGGGSNPPPAADLDLSGTSNPEIMEGDTGNDTLKGNDGDDTLYGYAGDDQLWGKNQNDHIYGGEGNDKMGGGNNHDAIYGAQGDDTLWGDSGNDTLEGGSDNDYIVGHAGEDLLEGGSGDDNLTGKEDNDTLNGGAGKDQMTGGTGADVFRFTNLSHSTSSAKDKIKDYEQGVDRLDVTGLGFTAIVAGAAVGTELGYTNGSSTTVSNADGSFAFTITGSHTLLDGDFIGLGANPPASPPPNQAPVANNDAATTDEDVAVTFNILANDSDPEDGTINAATIVLGAANNGSVVSNGDGTVTYTPNAGFFGSDSFTYTVEDSVGDVSNTATVNLTVNEVQPPQPPADVEITGTSAADDIDGGAGNDTLRGNDGNDTLKGHDGDDQLWGKNHDDLIYGGNGNDKMGGGNDNDEMNGESGNDTMWGDAGDDTLRGGSDDDQLYGSDGDDRLWGQNGNDAIYGDAGNEKMGGGNGNDNLNGGLGIDTMWGDAGDDTLRGGDGGDQMYGGDGHDRLWGQNDNDVIFGGAGDEKIGGGNGNDNLKGESGQDTMWGDAGDDTLDGGDGNDQITGGDGTDIARYVGNMANFAIAVSGSTTTITDTVGTEGVDSLSTIETIVFADGVLSWDGNQWVDPNAQPPIEDNIQPVPTGAGVIEGTNADENIASTAGNDSISGLGGKDTINGGDGDDAIWSSDGADSILGGNGNDTVYAGVDNDRINDRHGFGNDLYYGEDGDDYIRDWQGIDTMVGGAGNDTLIADGGDLLLGGAGNDQLSSSVGDDTMDGGDGDDYIMADADYAINNDLVIGGAGNDTLFGNQGADTINGGEGNDIMYAIVNNDNYADGIDTFIFEANSGIDELYGFNVAEDIIQLVGLGFNSADEALAAVQWQGLNSLLDLGNSNSVLIHNVENIDLTVDNFMIL